MNRKLWSNEEKVAIIIEILRGDESAAAICTRHCVSATQAYRWLDRFLKEDVRPSPTSGPGWAKNPCWMKTAA